MKGLASQLTATAAAFGLVFAPAGASANTRAADSASLAQPSEDDGAGLLPLGRGTVVRNQDWLLILFGTVATIGALAIVLSGKSSGGTASGPNQVLSGTSGGGTASGPNQVLSGTSGGSTASGPNQSNGAT